MLFDISDALIKGLTTDMTCTFPGVIETLRGTDTNLELVTSSTLKPLKLSYQHNTVRILRGYIFVQEYLEGFDRWQGAEGVDEFGRPIGERQPAVEVAKKVKEEMMDQSSLNIPDVELHVNLTKD